MSGAAETGSRPLSNKACFTRLTSPIHFEGARVLLLQQLHPRKNRLGLRQVREGHRKRQMDTH